ncbi:MAG: hypothetical protein KKC51_03900 [Verrucomicrobia bacterium]|nr:hypothetical protein [Verrucomicrobiota bacterium]
MNNPQTVRNGDRLERILFLAVILFVLLAVFRSVLAPGRFLFTSDDNIGDLAMRKSLLPGGFLGGWNDGALLGYSTVVSPGWTHMLLWLMPLRMFINWIHGLDLVLASLALAAFLRRRDLSWPACAVAALTAFWVGSNFTLTYAGHIMKFGILMWAAVYMWLLDRAVESGRPALAVLAGGALGAMFLEQADVALFFALVLGPYALVRLSQAAGASWRKWGGLLGPLLLSAGLIAFYPLWENYRANVRGVASMERENPAEKWAYVTQWSWPPEESIDFIAPGYMGWRSGEPEGPYWGRMGRSEGWEKTRSGFQNFKLENQYLGAIPIMLALAALLGARAGSPRRMEVVFWGAAALVTLLLSFGKHFPLYAVFYQLPVINNIRNPNKFLQVFQLAVAILAACGFDRVLSAGREPDGSIKKSSARFV